MFGVFFGKKELSFLEDLLYLCKIAWWIGDGIYYGVWRVDFVRVE